jgi:hypothetical protein
MIKKPASHHQERKDESHLKEAYLDGLLLLLMRNKLMVDQHGNMNNTDMEICWTTKIIDGGPA